MGERIRNCDWNKTGLGSPEHWEQSLKTSVSICLNSNFPIAIYWGEDLTLIYNDAWSPIPGSKHPWALGKPAREVWSEIWDNIEPEFKKAFEGKPGGAKDALLPMQRHGYTEECYFDFTFTPVFGDTTKVAGVFNAVIETTHRVIAERRSLFLNELNPIITGAGTREEVFEKLIRFLQLNNKLVSFGIHYTTEYAEVNFESSTYADNEKSLGLRQPLPFEPALTAGSSYFISDLDNYFEKIPRGFWDEAPKEAIIVPLKNGNGTITDILVFGLNARRRYDDEYKSFFETITNILTNVLNNIGALAIERRRTETLAELDRAKTLFFTNISHEFRTPLTLLLSPLEELLNKHAHFDDAEKQNIETALRNALRLLKLVNALLDFSRIESGRQLINYSLADIVALTRNLAANFRSVFEKAGLHLIIKAGDIKGPVYIDTQMWEKIIFNLLSNAFKYTLKGAITLELSEEEHMLVLKVRDTGVGIPKEELPKMFERFHRVQGVTGRTYEGTGIGLSLVKELVQMHHGEITVDSILGKGSVFTIKLPLGSDHVAGQLVSKSSPEKQEVFSNIYLNDVDRLFDAADAGDHFKNRNTAQPLVLVVDDNADMREHISSVLSNDFQVVTAVNGIDALRKIREAIPSLILSDLMMPEMDGIGLLREVKTNPATSRIPVILLTARAGEESKIEGLQTGADDYLVKPFSSRELIARLHAQIKLSAERIKIETNLRNTIMQAPVAMGKFAGPDHILEFANEKIGVLLGRSAGDIIGRPVFQAFPDLEKQGFKELMDNVYLTGKPHVAHEMPVEFARKGKASTLYLNFNYEPFRETNGDISGVLLVAMDVTEQVQARKKVEESEKEVIQLNKKLASELASVKQLQELSSHLIHKEEDEQNIYDELLNASVKIMNSDLASLQLYHQEAKTLTLVANRNFHPLSASYWHTVSADSGSVCGEALRNGLRIVVSDIEAEDFAKSELSIFRHSGIRAVQSTPLLSRNGKIIGMISTHWKAPRVLSDDDFIFFNLLARQAADIIERTESEKKLSRNAIENSKLAAIVQSSEDAIVSKTLDSIVTSWNTAAQKLFGYSAEEMIGQPITKIIPTDRLFEEAEIIDKIQNGQIVEHFQTKRMDKHGNLLDISLSISPIRNNDGKIIGASKIARNITREKEAEERVRQSERQFRQLADALPQLVWTTDKNGNGEFASKRWKEYTGLNISLPESWDKVVHPDDLASIMTAWVYSLETGVAYRAEARLRNRDGSYRWHSVQGEPIRNQAGEIVKWCGAFTDIEEQKLREKEKDNFISVASHEMKTPLTSLKGYVQLLQDMFSNSDDETAIQFLNTLERQVEKLINLVKDLFDVTKMKEGLLTLSNGSFVMDDLIREVVDSMKHGIKSHTLVMELDAPVNITADRERIGQVLINLISNAVRYSPEANKVIVTSVINGNFVIVCVQDFGIGISGDMHTRIFDRFFRVNEEEVTTSPGLGLGLYISSEIIRRHSGKIAVSSEKGKGSSFCFTLPIHGNIPQKH